MPNRSTSNILPRGDLYGAILENPGPNTYLADVLFPKATVPNRKGSISQVPIGAMTPNQSIERSAKSGYARGDWAMGENSYKCREYGWEEVRDDGEAADYADYFDYEMVLARRIDNVIKIQREIRAKDLVLNTTTYNTGDVNDAKSVSVPWVTAATADPIGDVQIAREGIFTKSGLMPNKMLISWRTWFALWEAAQIKERRIYVEKATTPMPTDPGALASLAALLGLKDIYVGTQFYTTNPYKTTETTVTEIWDDDKAFLWYGSDSADLSLPTLGRTFSYDADGGMMELEQYRSDETRGDVYRGRQVVQEKLVLPQLGYLLSNLD